MKEKVTIQRNGLTLKGEMSRPEGKGPFPAVILSHGYTGNYSHLEAQARFFREMGYATFAFSFCGGSADGTPEEFRSEGSTQEMTLRTETEDLLAVYDYAVGRSWVDAGNVVLYGESQGGMVSGLAAARLKEKIKKLILIYPALCIPDHARMGILGGARYDPANPPQVLDCGIMKLGRIMHESSAAMDPYLELSGYRGEVLVLHGLEDQVVNYTYSIRLQQVYGTDRCRLQLIQKAGHGFNEEQGRSAFASIRQFLEDRREILTIRVIVTRVEKIPEEGIEGNDVYFTAWCDTPFFRGATEGEGCDRQTVQADGSVRLCAAYTLYGKDADGKTCHIRIVNQSRGGEWKPEIETDSESLAFLGTCSPTAVLEHGPEGPVVRIFGRE